MYPVQYIIDDNITNLVIIIHRKQDKNPSNKDENDNKDADKSNADDDEEQYDDDSDDDDDIDKDRKKGNDMIYIFGYNQDLNNLNELDNDYAIGMMFNVVVNNDDNDTDDDKKKDDNSSDNSSTDVDNPYNNIVKSYFHYGIGERMRFYPELIVHILPRIFNKYYLNLSQYDYYQEMFSSRFKHAWSIDLTDNKFNNMYKTITGTLHVSVNYNRNIVVNAMDDQIDYIYDDQAVDDNNPSSPAAPINHVCKLDNQMKIIDCPHIEDIIKALKLFQRINFRLNKNNNNINITKVIGDYDHIIKEHQFCSNNDKRKELQQYMLSVMGECPHKKNCHILNKHANRRNKDKDKNNINLINDKSDDQQEILYATLYSLHSYLVHSDAELYRMRALDDEDVSTRFSSGTGGNKNKPTDDIKTKDNANDSDSDDDDNKTQSAPSKQIANINFGVSVLEWFKYNEPPKYSNLREEVIEVNKDIIADDKTKTVGEISEKIYDSILKEVQHKIKCHSVTCIYVVNELMALKLYTDSNNYCSQLRKAFWTFTSKEVRKSYFYIAINLYKAHLFAASPIPRISKKNSTPMNLFHGLNEIFIVNESMPMYNGPMSTTLQKSVAHSFSDSKGLLWTIKPSYANKFKFVVGIIVDWISQYKNESEVLLFNQFIPIQSIHNFENNTQNQIDHLMLQLKEFKDKTTKKQFYRQIGFSLQPEWIQDIAHHDLLFEVTEFNKKKTVLHRLVEELKVNELSNMLNVFKSKFVLSHKNKVFHFNSWKMMKISIHKVKVDDPKIAHDVDDKDNDDDNKDNNNDNDDDDDDNLDKIFDECKYKIINNDTNGEHAFKYNEEINTKPNHSYSVYICNDKLFGRKDNQFILLQQFKKKKKKIIEKKDDDNKKKKKKKAPEYDFCEHLELLEDAVIKLNKEERQQGIEYKYEYNFDENGVLYAIGTKFKTESYKNPGKTGGVTIKTSQMYSDYKGHQFIDHKEKTGSMTDNDDSAFFSIDLMKYKLKPTDYTMRNYDNSNHILRWNLMGSADGKKWIVLKKHLDDKSLEGSFKEASWKLNLDASINKYYKHFKVMITGNNSYPSKKLYCSGFELYGDLLNIDDDDDYKEKLDERQKHIFSTKYMLINDDSPQINSYNGVTYTFNDSKDDTKKDDDDDDDDKNNDDDKNSIQFIVPFNLILSSNLIGVYVQPQKQKHFTLIKTFDFDKNKYKEDNKDNKINHLFKVLRLLNNKIPDGKLKAFFDKISFTVNDSYIKSIKNEISAVYEPESIYTEMIRLLTNTFRLKQLSTVLKLFTFKLEQLNEHKLYEYFRYKMRNPSNTIADHLKDSVFKIERIEKGNNNDIDLFKYNDTIYIKPGGVYKIYVSNDALFETTDTKFILMQIVNKPKDTAIKEFVWQSHFDTNGLFYALGTKFGQTSYKNPAITDEIELKSTELSKGNIEIFTGRESSTAYTKNKQPAWFTVKIKDYTIRPTYYSLRNTATENKYFLKNWELQASTDGKKWKCIRKHTNDESLSGESTPMSWALENVKKAYKNYRIWMSDKNGKNDWCLNCSGMELYGQLFTDKKNKFYRDLVLNKDNIVTLTHNTFIDDHKNKILNSRFMIKAGTKQQITIKNITNDDQMIAFDYDQSIETLQFIIPYQKYKEFNKHDDSFGLYVQSAHNQDYIVFKSFKMKKNEYIKDNKQSKIDYLYNVLLILSEDHTKNLSEFYGKIGFRVDNSWLPALKIQLCSLMDAKRQQTILTKLIKELKFDELKIMSVIFSPKLVSVDAKHVGFNYATYKLEIDADKYKHNDEEKKKIENSKYKLVIEDDKYFDSLNDIEEKTEQLPNKYVYSSDFDKNGFLYAIGTLFNKKNYKNPVLTSEIFITAAEMSGTDKQDLIGREKTDSYSKDKEPSYFYVDLKEHKFKVTHYSLRNYAHDSRHMTDWDFLASNDATTWTILKRHVNCHDTTGSYKVKTWELERNKKTNKYYKYFKIEQKKKNTYDSWALYCSWFELYGELYADGLDKDYIQVYSYQIDHIEKYISDDKHKSIVHYHLISANYPKVHVINGKKISEFGDIKLTKECMDEVQKDYGIYKKKRKEEIKEITWVPKDNIDEQKDDEDDDDDDVDDDKNPKEKNDKKDDEKKAEENKQIVDPRKSQKYVEFAFNESVQLQIKCKYLIFVYNEEIHDDYVILQQLETKPVQKTKQFVYKSDFDENGIVYALGTDFGKKKFVNPHLARDELEVLWSERGTGSIEFIVGRELKTAYTKNKEPSWFTIHFFNYSLRPTHYTIRNTSSDAKYHLKFWELQGSNDDEKYDCLKKHDNDMALSGKSTTNTWKLENIKQSYQYFRIWMNKKNNGNDWCANCSGFEMYGEIQKKSGIREFYQSLELDENNVMVSIKKDYEFVNNDKNAFLKAKYVVTKDNKIELSNYDINDDLVYCPLDNKWKESLKVDDEVHVYDEMDDDWYKGKIISIKKSLYKPSVNNGSYGSYAYYFNNNAATAGPILNIKTTERGFFSVSMMSDKIAKLDDVEKIQFTIPFINDFKPKIKDKINDDKDKVKNNKDKDPKQKQDKDKPADKDKSKDNDKDKDQTVDKNKDKDKSKDNDKSKNNDKNDNKNNNKDKDDKKDKDKDPNTDDHKDDIKDDNKHPDDDQNDNKDEKKDDISDDEKNKNDNTFNVFCQPFGHQTFLLIKTFTINSYKYTMTNNIENKVNYLFDLLGIHNHTITNATSFYSKIGFIFQNEMVPLIKKKLIEMDDYDKRDKILNKLAIELKVNELSVLAKTLLTKFECAAIHDMFKYCSYKTNVDKNDIKLFNHNQYKLVHINYNSDDEDNDDDDDDKDNKSDDDDSDNDNDEKKVDPATIQQKDQYFKYDDEMTLPMGIKYLTFISNDTVFGNNKYIFLQHFKTSHASMYSHIQLKFKSNFDRNGIFYALGTDFGQNDQFQNPARNGKVTVTSSEMYTDYKAYEFISREKTGTMTDNDDNAFVAVDLKLYKLKPTHYSLRNYDKATHILKWNFLGSCDGTSWVVLKKHWDDASLQGEYTEKTWKLTLDKTNDKYFKHFKVMITGDNSYPSQKLYCSGWEIYGHLLKVDDDEINNNLFYDNLKMENDFIKLLQNKNIVNNNKISRPILNAKYKLKIRSHPSNDQKYNDDDDDDVDNKDDIVYQFDYVRDFKIPLPPTAVNQAQLYQLLVSPAVIDKNAFSDDADTIIYKYVHDFDQNGLFYALGTSFGKDTQYQNPAITEKVEIVCSSINESIHSSYDFIGRQETMTFTENESPSFFYVDIGRYRVKPTHYTLRQYNRKDPNYYLQNWNFEASINAKDWFVLKKHRNDQSLQGKSATKTWVISAEIDYDDDGAAEFFSYFRIRMTKAIKDDKKRKNFWNLPCSGMEIYGPCYQFITEHYKFTRFKKFP